MTDITGTSRTWEIFSNLDPVEVCLRTEALYDKKSGLYSISSFSQTFHVDRRQQKVFSNSQIGKYLLGFTDYFFDLSILWYLIGSQDIPLSGRMVKPAEIEGGQIFVKGTHILPLEKIASRYNDKPNIFWDRCSQFGGKKITLGDISAEFHPFAKVPATLILWFGDEEFPPNAQLLLDSTCTQHLSTDVLWAVTMINCLSLLQAQ
jgi:hypothetical protein